MQLQKQKHKTRKKDILCVYVVDTGQWMGDLKYRKLFTRTSGEDIKRSMPQTTYDGCMLYTRPWSWFTKFSAHV